MPAHNASSADRTYWGPTCCCHPVNLMTLTWWKCDLVDRSRLLLLPIRRFGQEAFRAVVVGDCVSKARHAAVQMAKLCRL